MVIAITFDSAPRAAGAVWRFAVHPTCREGLKFAEREAQGSTHDVIARLRSTAIQIWVTRRECFAILSTVHCAGTDAN